MRHLLARTTFAGFSATRLAAGLLPIITALILTPVKAGAIPIYLRTDSRFPSGHYHRAYLEGLTDHNQEQQWRRVETKDRAYGWLPNEHLVTAIDLAARAVVVSDVNALSDQDADARIVKRLQKGTNVSILGSRGTWIHVSFLTGIDKEENAWVASESLTADLSSPCLRAFIPDATLVYAEPNSNSRIRMHIRESRFVRVVSERPGWIEVRYDAGSTGFINRTEAVTLTDLGSTGARVRFALAPLRSAPFPYADLVRSLTPRTPLTTIAYRNLRWGRAHLRDLGAIWWPITDEIDDARRPQPGDRLSTAELFKRKVFDMATSPKIPTLKFVSADGVFRTNDTRQWTRLSTFENKNFPIAIAGGGSIFVGPYVSLDHGETFEQWIRWDRLVSVLGRGLNGNSPTRDLRILEIKPQDTDGQNIRIKLTLGAGQPIMVATSDQGSNWRRVSFRP